MMDTKLEAAEKDIALKERIIDSLGSALNAVANERDALQAKVEAMEKQEPVAWAATDETGAVVEALGMNQSRRFDTALYLAPGAQPAPKAVAYLDIGAGGYMDIGTDLNDEQLASLPKGRHMLGIVGTYGVEGYSPAQPAVQGETGWQPIETAPKDNKRPLYLAQFDEEGTLINIDFDGTWEREIESWEAPNMYYYWASAHGNIEEPTHWAYQDAGAPPQEPSHDNQ